MEDGLLKRLDYYAECVGRFAEFKLNTKRQIQGDLKELRYRCEIHNLDYRKYAKYYIKKCREYYRPKHLNSSNTSN